MSESFFSPFNLWLAASGVLVVAELLTGTFYLLMLALGAAAGALATTFGLGFNGQLLVAALVGGGLAAAWYQRRKRAQPDTRLDTNSLDVGERVTVTAWQPDGSAQVAYRGSWWPARYAGEGAPAAGPHRIQSLEGSCLLLVRAP
jgi:membrane protein implicated in regulation of membrane protease activity